MMNTLKRRSMTTEDTEEHRARSAGFLCEPLCPLWLIDLWSLALATLREIFDESAYDRFLARRGLTPSAASYADFRLEHETTKVHPPRCC